MTTTYLHTSVYDPTSDLQQSDQITVPADVWSMFDRDHTGAGPVFVTVKDYLTEIPLLGRIRPAVPEDGLAMDTMRLPSWIWLGLGVPLEDAWIELTVATPYLVEKVVLRPNRHAELVSLSDPAATLSAQIMGSGSGGWGSLTVGMDLDLPCGVFRVEELTDVEGVEIQSGCILDADIRLDFLPAWDYEPPVRFPAQTPPPEPVPVLGPMVPFTEQTQTQTQSAERGFVPFSGAGHRLGR